MSAKKLFWILFLLNLFNYIDRQVLFAVFPLIQTDLKITDWQLGTLASVFMLVYMCYAPLVGYYADRTQRQKWIGASALIWSVATLACGWAKSYTHLLFARSCVGMGEAGFTTIAQPFLAENYPARKRATMLACFGLALPAGSALGYFLGGVIGQQFGWRMAFMLVGIPGVFLGLLALTQIKDFAHKGRPRQERPTATEYMALLKNKPFLFICLAHAMVTFTQGGLSAWMPTYFHRYFEMDVAKAGLMFGFMVIFCGALGTYAGGRIADRLLPKTSQSYFITIFASMLLMMPFAWVGLSVHSQTLSLLLFSGAITCIFLPMGPIAAALVAFTNPKVHSMAFALNLFIIHALGDALSPMFIGHASDVWGLKMAVWLCTLSAIPACVFIWIASQKTRALPIHT